MLLRLLAMDTLSEDINIWIAVIFFRLRNSSSLSPQDIFFDASSNLNHESHVPIHPSITDGEARIMPDKNPRKA